ncbi:MAG: Coenzyme F420 hydrogenase/dehydrogenase, beta subunit C-terminal domain, partial [Sphingopyxis sp.]
AMSYEESWGRHLSGRVQYRCKICPDAVGGAADIACADAWYGGESGYPDFDERDGRSLIITRTGAGDALLAGAGTAGRIATTPQPIADIALMQPAQARRKRLVRARMWAARLLARPVPVVRGLSITQASRDAPWGEVLHNLFGSLRRILVNRR